MTPGKFDELCQPDDRRVIAQGPESASASSEAPEVSIWGGGHARGQVYANIHNRMFRGALEIANTFGTRDIGKSHAGHKWRSSPRAGPHSGQIHRA